MPLAVAAHNSMLADFKAKGDRVQLLSSITVTSAVSAGATTVVLSSANVAVGDYISLNAGTNRETFKVTAKSGSTATVDRPVVNAYPANSDVGWAPKTSGSLATVGGMVAITWGTPANEALAIGASVTIPVTGNSAVGGFAVYNQAASNQFLGSFLTNSIEKFGADGEYVLTNADVSLAS